MEPGAKEGVSGRLGPEVEEVEEGGVVHGGGCGRLGLEVEEVEEGGVVHGGRGRRSRILFIVYCLLAFIRCV